jgi:histidyl-tRNA synthetase
MEKQNLQTLKGFRDFLPPEAIKRAWLKNKIIEVFERWGYEPLETPTLEPLELFSGQIGEDEKLFFKFEDLGGRKVALRYEQTVPTCRVIGKSFGKIVFPFRRYQIQSNFRSEKPQRGRYREFVQCDLDMFGVASPIADAEIIAVSLDLFRKLGFKKAIALVNNRDLMKDIPYDAIVAIDKLKKIGEEGITQDMISKGIKKEKALEYFNFVKNLRPDETIKTIFDYLNKSGFTEEWYRFEPTLARSFSYSQGPIWEIIIPEYDAGSVAGGERYDALVEKISGRKIPGTGVGIGFDRTLEALEVCGLIPSFHIPTKVLVTVFSSELLIQSIKVANLLREKGVNTELYPDESTKLDKQLKYADKKGIPFAVIIGPDESKNNSVVLKSLKNKNQEKLSIKDLETFKF